MDALKFYTDVQEDGRESGGYLGTKIRFIQNQSGFHKTILEIGCNDGFIGEKLLQQKNDVYGIDIVRKNLAQAKKRGLKTKFCNVEKQKLPFQRDFFDVVIIGDIIEHVFDTDFLLQECSRVLKTGGKLIVTTPNVASLGRRMMLLFGYSPYLEYSLHLSTNGLPSVGHIRYYTRDTLEKQLRYNNFHSPKTFGDALNLYYWRYSPIPNWLSPLAINLYCVAYK